ncbi:MAG: RepB family plasmid replication initiator protein [Flavobacteriales bacterium]|nr:RepB family plasmid replication initiator protein [Flavobacteriales bacterium]
MDERRFTYQERMFIYFWVSRTLSHDFNFDMTQYASFRGFPMHSCASNLRSILKRLQERNFLTYVINKEQIFVHFDESFNISDPKNSVYLKKDEINSMPSVVTLRLFELLCCLSDKSCSVTISADALKKYIGIHPTMYGVNTAFFSRLVKPSLKNISQVTRIIAKATLSGDNVVFYVLSEM